MPKGIYARKPGALVGKFKRVRKNCTFKGCKRYQHGSGLCNKHRKWITKGIMDKDHNILRPLKKAISYKGISCKAEECEKPARRNGLCSSHSSMLKRGTYRPYAEASFKQPRAYSKDLKCFLCGDGGKIRRGFCSKHYRQLQKGFIDHAGLPTGKEKKRVQTYKNAKCKIGSCYKRPRAKGFCTNHYDNFRKGYYDINGLVRKRLPARNKGRRCKECDQEAHCRGYCVKHYSRFKRGIPLKDKDLYTNKGKKCEVERCEKPAIVRGYCYKHNYRLMKGIPLNAPPRNTQRKFCTICNNGAVAVAHELCKKHYDQKWRLEKRNDRNREKHSGGVSEIPELKLLENEVH